jgi:hypothetical protein
MVIVGKRDRHLLEKGQHLLGPLQQAIKQILGRVLLALPTLFWNLLRAGCAAEPLPSSSKYWITHALHSWTGMTILTSKLCISAAQVCCSC